MFRVCGEGIHGELALLYAGSIVNDLNISKRFFSDTSAIRIESSPNGFFDFVSVCPSLLLSLFLFHTLSLSFSLCYLYISLHLNLFTLPSPGHRITKPDRGVHLESCCPGAMLQSGVEKEVEWPSQWSCA